MPAKGPYVPDEPCKHESTMSQEERRGDELWYFITCLICGARVQEGLLGKIEE